MSYPSRSMVWAMSFEISNTLASRSLEYRRSSSGVPLKPIVSPSRTWPAYSTEKYLIIVASPSHPTSSYRAGKIRRLALWRRERGQRRTAEQRHGQRPEHQRRAHRVEDREAPHAEDHATGGRAEGAHQAHGEIGHALDRRALGGHERIGQERAAGHEREVPADPVEEQREDDQPTLAARRQPREDHRAGQHQRADADHREPSEPVAQPARERRGHEHAAQMERHRQPDRLHGVSVIVQVYRRRRGRADHHELADRERRERELHSNIAQDRAEWTSPPRRPARFGDLVESASNRQRIGPQEDFEENGGQDVASDADEERAGRR